MSHVFRQNKLGEGEREWQLRPGSAFSWEGNCQRFTLHSPHLLRQAGCWQAPCPAGSGAALHTGLRHHQPPQQLLAPCPSLTPAPGEGTTAPERQAAVDKAERQRQIIQKYFLAESWDIISFLLGKISGPVSVWSVPLSCKKNSARTFHVSFSNGIAPPAPAWAGLTPWAFSNTKKPPLKKQPKSINSVQKSSSHINPAVGRSQRGCSS